MTTIAMTAEDMLRQAFPGCVLLTVEETAEVLRTSVPALRGQIHRGIIPVSRVGGRVLISIPALAGLIAGTPTTH